MAAISEEPAPGTDENESIYDYEASDAGGDARAPGDARAAKRARTTARSGADDTNNNDKEDNVPPRAADNAPPAESIARLFWFDVAPPDAASLTSAQLESAAKITIDDLAGCMMLPVMELHDEDDSYPERFTQSGVTVSEDEHKIKGITAAFNTARARTLFIQRTKGIIQVSSEEDSDDVAMQVPYTVRANHRQQEMAKALMRRDSARITFNLKNAPFEISPQALNQAIRESFKGVSIAVKARQNSEVDSKGRPMRSVMGNKPSVHARISKSGGRVSLPRVVVISGPGGLTHPVRYQTEEGYFRECNGCHQDPCECEEVQAELQRALDFTAAARERQKARSEGKKKAGSSEPQRSMRDELLARRGEKGKAMVKRRTAEQKQIACWNHAKGLCKWGDKCAFSHAATATGSGARDSCSVCTMALIAYGYCYYYCYCHCCYYYSLFGNYW